MSLTSAYRPPALMSLMCRVAVASLLPLLLFPPTFPYVRAQTEGDIGDAYLDAYEDYDEYGSEPVLGREPTFDVPIINVTVIAGQDAMLPCAIENLGRYQIAWMDQNSVPLTFEDRKIVDDTRFSVVRAHTTEWTLMIREVTWEDRGEYRCTINTNPVRSKIVMLHVKVPATIIDELSSDDVIVKEGDTVVLVCNVTGIPKPTVTWYRQPVNSKGIQPKEKLQSHGEMLMIANISRYCDSYYLCEASNGIPPKVTRQMKVTVEFAPEIRLRTFRIGQQLEKDTILECQITAYPMAINFWRKGSQRIMSSTKYRLDAYDEEYHTITLSLRIMNIADSDYGDYTCVAENRLGSDSESMKLYKIHTKPRMVPVLPTAPPSGAKTPFPVKYMTPMPRDSSQPGGDHNGQYIRVDNKQPRYSDENNIDKEVPSSGRITDNGCSSLISSLWLPLLWMPVLAVLAVTSGGRQL